jgi:hypothetical protein
MGLLQALNLPPPPQRAPQPAPAQGVAVAQPVARAAKSARQLAPTGNPVVAALAPSGKGPSPGATPVTLAIHKPGPFEPGSQQQLKVTAMLSDGSTASFTAKVKWSTSDEALVKVLPGGLAKVGYGAGAVTITATAPGGKPRVSINVKAQARLQDIVVTPENPLVESGKTEILTATGVYADGSTEDLTAWVEWSSNKPNVVDFPEPGSACVAKAAGTASVAATDAATKVSGFTKVTVAAAGKLPALHDFTIEPLNPDIKGVPVQFKAKGTFADKSTHEITGKVKWESAHPRILRIEEDTGLARPTLQSGAVLIRASDRATNRQKSTTTYVEFPGIVRLTVSPKDVSVRKGDRVQVDIIATLRGGTPMKVHDLVQWTPADEKTAVHVPGSNEVLGVAAGATNFEVFESTSETSATFTVTVLPLVLDSIAVLPLGETIPVGQTLAFVATGQMSDLTLQPLDKPTWSSSRPDLIDVDQIGVATAKAPGDAVIKVQDRATGIVGTVGVTAVP